MPSDQPPRRALPAASRSRRSDRRPWPHGAALDHIHAERARLANGPPASTRLASWSWRTRIQSADANPRRPGLRSISTPFVARSAARRTPTFSSTWSAIRRRRSRSAMNALSSAPRSRLRDAANRLERRFCACVDPGTWLASARRPQGNAQRARRGPSVGLGNWRAVREPSEHGA